MFITYSGIEQLPDACRRQQVTRAFLDINHSLYFIAICCKPPPVRLPPKLCGIKSFSLQGKQQDPWCRLSVVHCFFSALPGSNNNFRDTAHLLHSSTYSFKFSSMLQRSATCASVSCLLLYLIASLAPLHVARQKKHQPHCSSLFVRFLRCDHGICH